MFKPASISTVKILILKNMNKIIFIIGLLIVAFLSISCDCEEEFLEEFDVDAVWEGRVMNLAIIGDLVEVTIQTSGSKEKIYTPKYDYLCNYPFEKGEEYIIFAYYNYEDDFYGKEGTYYTTICTYTMTTLEWNDLMGD